MTDDDREREKDGGQNYLLILKYKPRTLNISRIAHQKYTMCLCIAWVGVYVYMCACVCMHVCMCMCICVQVCVHIYACVCMCTCVCVCVCARARMCVCLCDCFVFITQMKTCALKSLLSHAFPFTPLRPMFIFCLRFTLTRNCATAPSGQLYMGNLKTCN
jgi:hypothetical protein